MMIRTHTSLKTILLLLIPFVIFGANAVVAEPLTLLSAPWADGERIKMKITSPQDGKPLGHLVFSADIIDSNKNPAWRIESDRFFSRDKTAEFTLVDAAKDSFIPLTAVTKNNDGDFNTVYSKNSITLTTVKDKKRSVSATRRSGAVYDNEQILHLVRRLPLSPGYKTSFKVFSATDDALADCKLEVARQIENTKWAKGQMPCYVVDIKAYVFFIKVEEHRLWISTDPNRWPVKHSSYEDILELTEFYTRPSNAR
jgi:hypothetical protein